MQILVNWTNRCQLHSDWANLNSVGRSWISEICWIGWNWRKLPTDQALTPTMSVIWSPILPHERNISKTDDRLWCDSKEWIRKQNKHDRQQWVITLLTVEMFFFLPSWTSDVSHSLDSSDSKYFVLMQAKTNNVSNQHHFPKSDSKRFVCPSTKTNNVGSQHQFPATIGILSISTGKLPYQQKIAKNDNVSSQWLQVFLSTAE